MFKLRSICYAATLALVLPMAGHAATLASITHDYGNSQTGGLNSYAPEGTNPLKGDRVKIEEATALSFRDTYDFSSIDTSQVSEFELILEVKNFGNSGNLATQNWQLNVFGGADPFKISITDLVGTLGTNNKTFSLNIDVSSSLFATVVANEALTFGFSEESAGTDNKFNLFSSTLNIEGESPRRLAVQQQPPAVPLPASGVLLVAGLAGIGALRRRRK